MSTVSVVIPCYKYGHFLADCVRSVLDEQEGLDVRVLIIDDASPDDSAEAAYKLAASDPRIEVRVHERNMGHIATYNEGLLEWADGDYVVLLSADDRLVPGALVRAAALLDAHPEAGFCYGRPLRFQHGGPLPAARTGSTGSVVYPGLWWLERRFREATGCITSPEVVVRTSLQRTVGGYDPTLPHAGDIEMWMRLAAHADVGYIRGADQAFYRVHGNNMSTTDFGGQLDDLRQRLIAFDSVLDKCGDRLPRADLLSQAVHTRLARFALRRAYRAYDRGRTGVVPVGELVAFAGECLPGYKALPEYRALRLRQRIGARTMPYLQPLVLSAVVERGREWFWWKSWKRRGI
ncbi:glycosyltransferase [Streptomyces sp. H10-C2]|uniref:glycosyltransferase family 2 protein n=1 Tax=unclassified Streptomyces TaxID=2593676 RepID=UPI0024B9ED65|nr:MULTISPECIES: glycosyltransferase [unclassified Streptomyces]MDJ0340934.1 glycosyltransferase [Streptomyces sp. PH10-H1]MDJ0369834.1 glycosyltransferase [Streptomyces sp. H10-C2]